MFCQKCGEEIMDEAVICPKCGCETGIKKQAEIDKPKTGMGVLFGLFLGIIGLIIGLCLFKEETIARKSFLKAWTISFCSLVITYCVGFILTLVLVSIL